MIANDNLISQIQTEVADILNADYELSSVDFIIENRRDIESEITTRLKKTGLCGTIMTPTLTMQGITDDHKDIVYQIDDLVVQVTEYVPINRANNKLSCQTCQDVAIRVADVLGGPTTTNWQNFQLVDIQTGEDSGLLVSKVTFRCLAQSDLSAMPAPYDPGKKIPFATKDYVDSEIKSLSDVYQPIGNYVTSEQLTSELNNYVTKAYLTSEVTPRIDTVEGNIETITTTLSSKLDKTNGTLSIYYNPDYPSQIVFDDSNFKVGIEPAGITYNIIDGVDKSLWFPMDEDGVIMTNNSTYTKEQINDKINEFAAHYLTWKDDEGHFVQFKSHGSLPNPEKGSLLWARLNHTASNPQFWYGDDPHTPDKNDYCVILEDETHNNETTRYSYVGDWPDGKWRYQYTINETALNTEQWAAINSTATKAKIDQIATNTATINSIKDNYIPKHISEDFTTTFEAGKTLTFDFGSGNTTKFITNAAGGYISIKGSENGLEFLNESFTEYSANSQLILKDNSKIILNGYGQIVNQSSNTNLDQELTTIKNTIGDINTILERLN